MKCIVLTGIAHQIFLITVPVCVMILKKIKTMIFTVTPTTITILKCNYDIKMWFDVLY